MINIRLLQVPIISFTKNIFTEILNLKQYSIKINSYSSFKHFKNTIQMKYHKILHCLKRGKIGEAPPTELPRLPIKTLTLHIGCVSYYVDLNARDKITKYFYRRARNVAELKLLPERLLPRPVTRTRNGMGNGGPRES